MLWTCALQMTAFAARLAVDCDRVHAGRLDCLPCLKLSPHKLHPHASETAAYSDATDAPGTESMTRQTDQALAHMPAADAAPLAAAAAAASSAPETADLPQVPPPDAESLMPSHTGLQLESDQPPQGVQSLTGRVKALGRSLKGAAKGGWSGGRRGGGGGRGVGGSRVYGVTPALHWYMEHVHAPLLAKPAVQLVTLAVFVGLFVLSLAALPHVSR